MIFLYSLILALLGSVTFLVQRRAAALGRRYSRLALSVQMMLRSGLLKPGNAAKPDPCLWAKSQYDLALLVQKRDRIETKHFAWQTWAERLARWTGALRSWKGKKLPYTLGVVDVWLVLALVDYLGVAEFVSAHRLVSLVTGLFIHE